MTNLNSEYCINCLSIEQKKIIILFKNDSFVKKCTQ